MNRDPATLLDIASAARLVAAFIGGLAEADFLTDAKTQSAVQHQLLIIGEAVKRLSPAFRAQYPTIPWTAMTGMRDQLIHGYDAVDLGEVWQTATRDLPTLLAALEPLLPRADNAS